MAEQNKDTQDFVEGDILLEDVGESPASKAIKKTVVPTSIVLSVIAVAVVSVYFVLDYRISKSDQRLVTLMENLQGNLDTKSLAKTIKESVASALKEVDTRLDVITKRVDALEQEIVVLKNKSADLNVTELMLLRDDLQKKIAVFDENQKSSSVKTQATAQIKEPKNEKPTTAKPVDGTSMSLVVPAEAPKIAQQGEEKNPVDIIEAIEPNHVAVDKKTSSDEVTLPFEVTKIVKNNIVNIMVGNKIYSISIDDEMILGRYEIRVVDMPNNIVFIYDTKLGKYFQKKVTGANK